MCFIKYIESIYSNLLFAFSVFYLDIFLDKIYTNELIQHLQYSSFGSIKINISTKAFYLEKKVTW